MIRPSPCAARPLITSRPPRLCTSTPCNVPSARSYRASRKSPSTEPPTSTLLPWTSSAAAASLLPVPTSVTVSHIGIPFAGTRLVTTTSSCERSEEHTSELQSPCNLVCRLLLDKKKQKVRSLTT